FVWAADASSLKLGEQPTWDPTTWEATVASTRSLREQLRRARAKGVTVRALGGAELEDTTSPLRREIEGIVRQWLATRAIAPMGFLVDLQPFVFAREKRFFVAEQA